MNKRAFVSSVVIFVLVFFGLDIPFGTLLAVAGAVVGAVLTYGAAGATLYSAVAARDQVDLLKRQEQRATQSQAEERQRELERLKPRLVAQAAMLQPDAHNKRFNPPTSSIKLLLEVTNHGPGVATNVQATLTATDGNNSTVDLGPIGVEHAVAKPLPLELGISWNATEATRGRQIIIDYAGGDYWVGGRYALEMYQEHPPLWRPCASANREPTLTR
jgi:hypothetical protein